MFVLGYDFCNFCAHLEKVSFNFSISKMLIHEFYEYILALSILIESYSDSANKLIVMEVMRPLNGLQLLNNQVLLCPVNGPSHSIYSGESSTQPLGGKYNEA